MCLLLGIAKWVENENRIKYILPRRRGEEYNVTSETTTQAATWIASNMEKY